MFGTQHSFPGVTHTRYNSFGEACTDVVVHYDHYVLFMECIFWSKLKPGHTNVEKNIVHGLSCKRTLEGLCAFAAYSQLVDIPYSVHIQQQKNGVKQNLLDMGKFLEQVVQFCWMVAYNPCYVLTKPDDGEYPLTVDGSQWGCPELFYKLSSWAADPEMSYFLATISAYFAGAARKWEEFSTEFRADGKIASLSPEERLECFLNTTNDINEGALGRMKSIFRHMPNVSLRILNAKLMYKQNRTSLLWKSFSPAERWFLRRESRRLSASGIERARRLAVNHAKAAAAVHHEAQWIEQQERVAERKQKHWDLMRTLIVDLNDSLDHLKSLTNPQLDSQLKFHRDWETPPHVKRKPGLPSLKANKISALQGAIQCYRVAIESGQLQAPLNPDGVPYQVKGNEWAAEEETVEASEIFNLDIEDGSDSDEE